MTDEERRILDKKLSHVKVPFSLLEHGDKVFTEEERNELLGMTRSLLAYTGCVIPRRIHMDKGAEVDLKSLVWNLMSDVDLTDDEVVAAHELANLLQKRVENNKKLMEEFDLSDDEAERLYFRTCGLMRAIMELRGLGDKDREDEYLRRAREENLKDAKRILSFFKGVRLK